MRCKTVPTSVLGLAALLCCAERVQAQSRFTSESQIYSIVEPVGWTKFPTQEADAAYAAPAGGTSRGTIFFGASDAIGTLDEESDLIADGNEMKDWQSLEIHGVPCQYFWTDDGFARSNALLCQLNVPTDRGPALTTFTLGSTSLSADWPAHTRVLWSMANSINWRDDTFP
jgi:hypothetical protein